MYRSLTFSFGSICFGSLLQSIMTAIRMFIEDARNRQQQRLAQANQSNGGFNIGFDSTSSGGCGLCGICYCVVECLAKMVEGVMHYFHQWAYVYVGIYGYSYLKSGKMVLELFIQRGWTVIIADNLVNYVFNCLTLVLAVMNGVVSLIVLHIVDNGFHTNLYQLVNGSGGDDGDGARGVDGDDTGNDFVAEWEAFVDRVSKMHPEKGGHPNDPDTISYVFGPLAGYKLYAFL